MTALLVGLVVIAPPVGWTVLRRWLLCRLLGHEVGQARLEPARVRHGAPNDSLVSRCIRCRHPFRGLSG